MACGLSPIRILVRLNKNGTFQLPTLEPGFLSRSEIIFGSLVVSNCKSTAPYATGLASSELGTFAKFRSSKAFVSVSSHLSLISLFSNLVRGSVRLVWSGMKLPTYVTRLKKLRVSSLFLGSLNERIVVTFSGSISMPLSDKMCPKNLRIV